MTGLGYPGGQRQARPASIAANRITQARASSMNTHKRGDHLLATGLSKTLGDLASMIDADVGQTSEGRALRDAVSRCTRYLTGGTFDAVID